MLNIICVRLVGGLGNQLFIYAFGLARSKKQKKRLLVDNISGFSHRDKYNAVCVLDDYKVKEDLIRGSIYKYFVANRYFWFLVKRFKLGHIERDQYSHDDNLDDVKSCFFQGYWQSYLYFHEYKDVLKEKLQLMNSENSKIIDYKNKILNTKNSVAIGMRFYDTFPGDAEQYGVKSIDYYMEAMKLIESKEKNLTYFVFSMNIERAKEELSICRDRNIIFVNPLLRMADAPLDMYLMSLCNHYIISNSTMYWWAAYLGEAENSMVICPSAFLNKNCLLPHWKKVT